MAPKLSLKWPYPSGGFTCDKLDVSADGKVALETSLTGVAPGLKFEFKGNDTDKADFSYTYTQPAVTLTGDIDIAKFSSVKTSVLSGSGPFTFGGSVDLKISKAQIESTNFSLGCGYSVPSKGFLGLRGDKNLANFSAVASYFVNKEVTLAGTVAHNPKDSSFTLASAYKCNPDTLIKVKANSVGIFSASVKQSLDKKFSVTGCAEFPSSFNSVRVGVNATLG